MSAERSELVTVLTGAAAFTLSGVVLLLDGAPEGAAALVVAVAYAAVAFIPLRLPQGDTVFGVVGVMVAAIALQPASSVVAGAVLGSVLALLLTSREQPWRTGLVEAFRQTGIAAGMVLLYPVLKPFDIPVEVLGSLPWDVIALAVLYLAVDLATAGAVLALDSDAGLQSAIVGLVRLAGPMYLALASVGVALAIVYPVMGLAGGAILVTLMALMKLSFGNYVRARTAYPKTVAVLARLAETELQEARGHAERVAELATAVGKRMHLGNKAVERLGLAALLHDIGKVKTGELHDDGQHADVGAELLEQIDFLNDLAPIVKGHHSTAADAVRGGDDLLAHVLYVVSYYDLRSQERPGEEVLADMRSRQGTEFDPQVVAALGRVCC
jgi:putative nucleotidyltransferase with HDIG domain